MKTYTYSFFWKFIYRYGNIILSPPLLFYTLSIVLIIDKNLMMLFKFIISLFALYFLNKSYFEFYKIVPYKIETDEEKIICSDFLFRTKTVTIYYNDIDSLSGGVFDGKYRGLMKVCDGKNKRYIGFFDRMIDSNKLITIILSKVDKNIYDEVIKKIQDSKLKPVKSK